MIHSLLIMQARLNSSRLPQKALLPIIDGMPSLLVAMLGLYGVADEHVLACDRAGQVYFNSLAEQSHFQLVVGDEEHDVLSRFIKAMNLFKSNYVIRATADNLVVGRHLVSLAMEQALLTNADYFCFSKTPYGSGVEVVRSEVLINVHERAKEVHDREHVTSYIYNHPNEFRVIQSEAPNELKASDLRSTLDTVEDYERLKDFFHSKSIFSNNIVEEYISWMRKRC